MKIIDGAFGFYHDFVVTDNYYVIFQNPASLFALSDIHPPADAASAVDDAEN